MCLGQRQDSSENISITLWSKETPQKQHQDTKQQSGKDKTTKKTEKEEREEVPCDRETDRERERGNLEM